MRRSVLMALTALVLGASALGRTASPAAADNVPIIGGGSSFAALEIDQWRSDTGRKPYSLKVNYVAQGSTFGRSGYSNGSLDFGASDITYQPDDDTKPAGARANYVYVPVSAGGLAFMYNLVDDDGSRITDLRLTPAAVCSIFAGLTRAWNDPLVIYANGKDPSGGVLNPKLTKASFNRPIADVVRSDGAGESFVLMEYCIATAPDVWHAFIAYMNPPGGPLRTQNQTFLDGKPSSSWPTASGGGVLGGDGIANTVVDAVTGRDSIGYDAASYAKVRGNWPVASVMNPAGVFTQPDEENVTVALGYASPNPDPTAVGTFILDFHGPDQRAYFPSTYSYVIAQRVAWDDAKGSVLTRFLCYSVTKGQEVAVPLRYARLSSQLVDIAINAISKIASDAQHPFDRAACIIKSATAPPPPPDVAPSGGGQGGGGASGGGGTGGGTSGGSTTATTARPSAGSATPAPASGDATTTIAASVAGVSIAQAASGGSSGTATTISLGDAAPPAGSDSVGTSGSSPGSTTVDQAVVLTKRAAPSNGDVILTLGQGGALSAAGVYVTRRRRRGS